MEASAGLVAGSHNRNELVVIRLERDGESAVILFNLLTLPSTLHCFLHYLCLHFGW